MSNEIFKEEVEANIGFLLEATPTKLNKLESNNAASVTEIKKHVGDMQPLTGATTKSTTVTTARETRFQSMEANMGKTLVQIQGFSQKVTSIQNQFSIMARGNFPLSAYPEYLGAPPWITPYTLSAGSSLSPMVWGNETLSREELRNIGTIPPGPNESGGGKDTLNSQVVGTVTTGRPPTPSNVQEILSQDDDAIHSPSSSQRRETRALHVNVNINRHDQR